MKKLLIVVFILSLILSCNIAEDMDDSVDLGNKYRFIQDAPKSIIYHKTKKYNGIGIIIVPDVVCYNFNNRYIIAKSFGIMYKDKINNQWAENKEKIPKYWIVDKKINGAQVEPLDSISFYKQLKELKIDLKFKEVGNDQ